MYLCAAADDVNALFCDRSVTTHKQVSVMTYLLLQTTRGDAPASQISLCNKEHVVGYILLVVTKMTFVTLYRVEAKSYCRSVSLENVRKFLKYFYISVYSRSTGPVNFVM